MSHNSHHYQFPTFFDQKASNTIHLLNLQETVEHTFDERNSHSVRGQSPTKQADHRTQDQVRNDLNFSIEDLLSKISRATADFDQPAKQSFPAKKTQNQHAINSSFKISNLSVSTQANSNRQKRDPIQQKNLLFVQINNKKRESEPQKQVIQTNDRFNQGQKHNSINHGFEQFVNYNGQKYGVAHQQQSSWNNNHATMKSDDCIDVSRPQVKSDTMPQWGRNSSRNQHTFTTIEGNKNFEYNNSSNEWGRNSSRNQSHYTFNNRQTESINNNQWGRNSSKNQFSTQSSNNQPISPQPTLSPQWGRQSSRNQPHKQQLHQVASYKNIHEVHRLSQQQKKQQLNRAVSKQQLFLPFENITKTQSVRKQPVAIQPFKNQHEPITNSSSKREIQALLNPFQNSGFGKNPNQVHQKSQTRVIAASIIIEDSPPKQQCQQIPIQHQKKVNSLFDNKKIREVAASTIMQSPQKMKKKKTTAQSPFMQIVKMTSNDPIIEEDDVMNLRQQNFSIKITSVQKSQILTQIQRPKLTIQDFHLGKQLGSGKFGDVYQAIHKLTGSLYAIKKIFKSTILQYNMIEQFTRELKIHYTLNYPNIIKLYTHFDDEYHIFLVMQYGQGGMLMQKVKNGQKFSSIIVEQMLRAVQYLHNKKIAHRDIKPQNIVLMFNDTAKMCDFGWSRVFDSDMKKTFCGTLDYVSPEMKDKGEYSLKIDVWSLGVLTFEMLCGYAPFRDEITNWKRKGGNLNKAWNWNILYPPQISSVAESFMRNLLKENPNQRANIRFCLNHLFIRKYNQMAFDQEENRRFKKIAYVLREDSQFIKER